MLDTRRIGGSLAAVGVLAGTPVALEMLVAQGTLAALAPVAIVAVVALGVLAVRLLWRGEESFYGMLLTLFSSVLVAGVTTIVAFFAAWGITMSNGLCGHTKAPPLIALPVYVICGVWAFQSPKRLIWAWPVAIVLTLGLMVALTAIVPGGHGFCED